VLIFSLFDFGKDHINHYDVEEAVVQYFPHFSQC